jgi:hypothetical protein
VSCTPTTDRGRFFCSRKRRPARAGRIRRPSLRSRNLAARNAVGGIERLRRGPWRRLGQASRACGRYLERRHVNLTYRLLEAAVGNGKLAEVGRVTRSRIELVEAFVALTPDRQWDQLVTGEPRLLRLEAQVAELARVNPSFGRALIGDARDEQALVALKVLSELLNRVAGFVSPQSDHRGDLLHTEAAQHAASTHLLGTARNPD